MGAIKGMWVRLRAVMRPSTADRELDDEIRFHIELETEKNLALGLSPDEARRRALVAFGGLDRFREQHRDVRGARWLEELRADSRYAVRTLLHAPVLTGAAILTIALGVGANTAIFSAVNAVILRPLPFASPERLVMLWEENPEKGWHMQVVAPANMLDWRERVEAFEDVAAYQDFASTVTITGDGPPLVAPATRVTGNFFTLLGAPPALGRTFRDEETWQTGAPVAVISDRLWRGRFGGDSAIIGSSIAIDGRSVEVAGVMPGSFAFPASDIDVWMPTQWDPDDRAQVFFRRAHWLRAIARVKPDVPLARADAQLQQVAERLKQEYPATNATMGAGMTPLHEFLVGDTRLPLLFLLSSVVVLLLIACANVGNLMLVRAAEREREVALRLALGAGRARLARQALTESLVLSLAGGVVGLVLGLWGTRALAQLQPEGMLRVREFGMDWRVLGYVLAITTASGLLFGVLPALWGTQRRPADALREGGRSGTQGRRMRSWGDALAAGEVALALLLTVGAGLLVRSYSELLKVNPGFDPRGVLAVDIGLPGARYGTADAVLSFYDELLRRTRALPQVSHAAVTRQLPLTSVSWTSDFMVAGRAPDEYGTEVAHREVSPEYFETMRIPVIEGRALSDADRQGTENVVVINEALARSYFRDRSPVGQRIAFDRVPDSTSIWRTIVGVVGSEHQTSLATPPQIEILAPIAQDVTSGVSLVVRTAGDPAQLTPSIAAIIADMDRDLPIRAARTMEEVHGASLARERYLMALLLAFAAVGLVLAVIGVYGVLAQLARARRREMGIRIALGAVAGQVRWLVVRHGLRVTLIGIGVGGVAALLATRAMRGLVYGIPYGDPPTYVVVALTIMATSVIAAWLPAARASRADPAVVLRGD